MSGRGRPVRRFPNDLTSLMLIGVAVLALLTGAFALDRTAVRRVLEDELRRVAAEWRHRLAAEPGLLPDDADLADRSRLERRLADLRRRLGVLELHLSTPTLDAASGRGVPPAVAALPRGAVVVEDGDDGRVEGRIRLPLDGPVPAQLEITTDLTPRAEALGGVLRTILRGFLSLLVLAVVLPAWVIRRKVQAQRRAEAELRRLATTDPLTGLANRAEWLRRTTALLTGPDRRPFAVLCLDLADFRTVNDDFGEAAGDALLRAFAARLEGQLRRVDLAARLEGDRFAVLRPGLADRTAARAFARGLVEALSVPVRVEGHDLPVELDVGIALAPADGEDAATLLARAEAALAEAQAAAGGTIRLYAAESRERERSRRQELRRLRAAIEGGTFGLVWQPQVELATGRTVACEALLRFPDDGGPPLSPARFVALAEESGLVVPLGRAVLHRACREALRLPEGVRASVNLSPLQFAGEDVPALVREVLAATGLAPQRLEIEITESVLLEASERVRDALAALRRLGVAIALDDFGTGYSSLACLWQLPFDKLKIDRSFVQGLGRDGQAATVLRSILALARSLGLTVTAEGIETGEQARFLAAHGCRLGQGFLFGRPQPVAAFEAGASPAVPVAPAAPLPAILPAAAGGDICAPVGP